jgi:DNA polymerase/3'-5' exonuclease PolX
MKTKKPERKTRKTRADGIVDDNMRIIQVLEMVKSYYAREHNTIHVNAYDRAIYQIRKWPYPIKKGADIMHLEGIGKGMVGKIDTIISTGTLPIILEKGIPDITTSKSNKSLSNITPISQVLGFSEKRAEELYKQYGIRTIEELKELVKNGRIKITRMQEMGVRYHKDLQRMVPRAEIKQIGNRIDDILSREGIIVCLAGSYPSGLKKESKDIDILLVARDSSKLKNKSYLEELASKLQQELPLETIAIGANKFLGLVKLPEANSLWRHLDMRLVNIQSFPYAWLYYSSGVIFNKMIREKLKKRGYKLNEWGLFKGNSRISLDVESLPPADIKYKQDNQQDNQQDTPRDIRDLLEYTEKIEKEIFKLAQLEYKTVRERY